MKARVVIVGAGASGLQCAHDLIQSNLFVREDIVILEARDRIGGRIYSTNEVYYPQETATGQEHIDNNTISPTTTTANDLEDSVPAIRTNQSKPIEYILDHGAAWVHGLGIDWGESMEQYNEKSKPFVNPMMELLQEEIELTTTTTMNDNNDTNSFVSQQRQPQQTVFTKHLYNTVCGNPWMRPYRVLHERNEIALFVNGQSIPNDSVLVQYAVDRHYTILKKISDLGNELLQQKQKQQQPQVESTNVQLPSTNGNRNVDIVDDLDRKTLPFSVENTSFHDMIVHVQEKYKDCLLKLLLDEKKKYSTMSTDDIELVQNIIVPFYIHLIECWYGTSAKNMRFYEFIVEPEDDENEEEDIHQQERREPWIFDGICKTTESTTNGSIDQSNNQGYYVGQGDFYGSHATLQNGMKSVLTPLFTKNGLLERIYLNNEVIQIEQKKKCTNLDDDTNTSSATTPYDDDDDTKSTIIQVTTKKGLIVHADYCIVTIPIGCLNEKLKQKNSTNSISNSSSNSSTATNDATTMNDTPPLPSLPFFVPSLSEKKIDAIARMEMSPYKKVFLTFDRIFWPSKPAFLGLILSNTNTTTENNNNKNQNNNTNPLGNYLLVDNVWARRGIPSFEGLLYSESGTWATHKSDDVIVEAVLQFVSNSLGISYNVVRDMYCTHHITRWEEDPYSCGAFTAMTVGATEEHKRELNVPEWNDTLFLSGEATIEDYEGCVHSALWSGTYVAQRILNQEKLQGKEGG